MRAPFQVFLLGTPGCGKSEVYRRLTDRVLAERLAREVTRIDDYPKMEKTYLHDDHDRLHRLGMPFLVVDNHLEGGAFLQYAIEEIVALLKKD